MSESNKFNFLKEKKYILKKQRKTISFAVKLDIIKRYEKGDQKTKIARDLGLAMSTVTTILKKKDKIKEYVNKAFIINQPSSSIRARIISKQRSQINEEMERILIDWIKEQNYNQITLTATDIQKKAKSIYDELKVQKPDDTTFIASNGWYHRFKRRFAIALNAKEQEINNIEIINHNNTNTNDNTDEIGLNSSSSLNSLNLESIITEGKYLPQQIFTVNLTTLLWFKEPDNTNSLGIKQEVSDFNEDQNERLTLLFGGNSTGDLKLKPLMIYHTENPLQLKGINKETLPVVWASNSNNCEMTVEIFERWFYHNFVSEITLYCLRMNIPFKILLLLNRSSKYPKYLSDYHSNIKVIYIPSDSYTFFQQPLNEYVINIFKILYLQNIYTQRISHENFSNLYNIYEAIKNINRAWEDIDSKNIKSAWKEICPQIFNEDNENDNNQSDEIIANHIKSVINMAAKLNIELHITDIQKWLEDPIWVTNQQTNVYEENISNNEMRMFTIKGLEEAFVHINAGLTKLEEMDPNVERYLKNYRTIKNALSCYTTIYNEKINEINPFLNM